MNEVRFQERVLPSFGFFLMLLLLPLAISLVFLPINAAIGFLIAVSAYFVAILMALINSPLIALDSSGLHVSKVSIPANLIRGAKVIEPKEVFAERGTRLDARAYTRFQIGVSSLIRIEIADAKDPTPYWLISTRKAEELAVALNANRAIL